MQLAAGVRSDRQHGDRRRVSESSMAPALPPRPQPPESRSYCNPGTAAAVSAQRNADDAADVYEQVDSDDDYRCKPRAGAWVLSLTVQLLATGALIIYLELFPFRGSGFYLDGWPRSGNKGVKDLIYLKRKSCPDGICKEIKDARVPFKEKKDFKQPKPLSKPAFRTHNDSVEILADGCYRITVQLVTAKKHASTLSQGDELKISVKVQNDGGIIAMWECAKSLPAVFEYQYCSLFETAYLKKGSVITLHSGDTITASVFINTFLVIEKEKCRFSAL